MIHTELQKKEGEVEGEEEKLAISTLQLPQRNGDDMYGNRPDDREWKYFEEEGEG